LSGLTLASAVGVLKFRYCFHIDLQRIIRRYMHMGDIVSPTFSSTILQFYIVLSLGWTLLKGCRGQNDEPSVMLSRYGSTVKVRKQKTAALMIMALIEFAIASFSQEHSSWRLNESRWPVCWRQDLSSCVPIRHSDTPGLGEGYLERTW
jgi:hypothetical protein